MNEKTKTPLTHTHTHTLYLNRPIFSGLLSLLLAAKEAAVHRGPIWSAQVLPWKPLTSCRLDWNYTKSLLSFYSLQTKKGTSDNRKRSEYPEESRKKTAARIKPSLIIQPFNEKREVLTASRSIILIKPVSSAHAGMVLITQMFCICLKRQEAAFVAHQLLRFITTV